MVAPKKEIDEETPDAEWWDRGILPNQTYDDLDKQIDDNENALLGITNLIEHPIQQEPPGIACDVSCRVLVHFMFPIPELFQNC